MKGCCGMDDFMICKIDMMGKVVLVIGVVLGLGCVIVIIFV